MTIHEDAMEPRSRSGWAARLPDRETLRWLGLSFAWVAVWLLPPALRWAGSRWRRGVPA